MVENPVSVQNSAVSNRTRIRTVRLFVLLFYMMLSMAVIPQTAHAAKQPKLSKARMTLVTGKSKQLKVKNYKGKVQWASSNPYVAKVSQKGVVKAKHMGYTVILAKAGDEILKCRVTVNGRSNKKEKPYIFCYENDREGRAVETGDAFNLAVMGGYNKTWTWTVHDTNYATLYDNGNHVSSMTQIGRKCVLIETFMGKSGTVLITAQSGRTVLRYNLVIHPAGFDASCVNLRSQVLSQIITPGMSAQEKCLAVAKWLANFAVYRITNLRDNSLLQTGVGQCYHYARTYDFMLEALGIPCDYVSSKGSPGHAWNQVLIDGAWYNIDVTSFDNTEDSSTRPYYYAFFLVSDYRYTMRQPRFNPYHNCTSTRYDACAKGTISNSPWETGEWRNY